MAYSTEEKVHALQKYVELGNATAAARVSEPTSQTIRRWADDMGIKRSLSEIMGDLYDPGEKAERAERLYTGLKISARKVADIMDEPVGTVRSWLRKRGVTRSWSEALTLYRENNGYKKRVHRTCRMRVETDRTWREIGDALGLHRDTCISHWNSKHNPYRKDHARNGEMTPVKS